MSTECPNHWNGFTVSYTVRKTIIRNVKMGVELPDGSDFKMLIRDPNPFFFIPISPTRLKGSLEPSKHFICKNPSETKDPLHQSTKLSVRNTSNPFKSRNSMKGGTRVLFK